MPKNKHRQYWFEKSEKQKTIKLKTRYELNIFGLYLIGPRNRNLAHNNLARPFAWPRPLYKKK